MFGFSPLAAAPFADVGASTPSTVFPLGVEGTASVNSVTVVAKANAYPAGLYAVGELGDITVYPITNVFAPGYEATAYLGSVVSLLNARSLSRNACRSSFSITAFLIFPPLNDEYMITM